MGHIPSNTFDSSEILTFAQSRKSQKSSYPYDKEKWIYYPDFYSEYRYILGTRGDNPLITIGINPSTAAPDNLDNTLKSVERMALRCGYDSFIMFNVYAQRATNPTHMDQECKMKLHKQNMIAFKWSLSVSKSKNPGIWAAWGTNIETRKYLLECLCDMVKIGKEYNARWYKAGRISKAGHPHHPLYLSNNTKLEEFDMDSYIKSFN